MKSAIGIDFGTSYSRVAVMNAAGPAILYDPEHPETHALLASRLFAPLSLKPSGNFSSALPWIDVKRHLNGTASGGYGDEISHDEVLELIFKELRRRAEALKSGLVNPAAVLSVPSKFGAAQQEKLKKAAAAAGFEVAGFLTDSFAIALAYAVLKRKKGLAAICSFGGGFIEVSVADLDEASVRILGTESLDFGGCDVDMCIASKLAKEIEEVHAPLKIKANSLLAQKIHLEAERAKCAVSTKGSYDIRIEDEESGVKFTKAFSRYELLEWTHELFEPVPLLFDRALKRAGQTSASMTEVILTGGLSRMPFLQEKAEDYFKKKVCTEIHPDQAVALGCAIQAGYFCR